MGWKETLQDKFVTTTHAILTAIQRSQASTAALTRELGLNRKTVAKRRERETVENPKTSPKEPRSTVLSEASEAMIVAFRRNTLLPLNNCLYALQPLIPHLTRSALHRCLQRHDISRLPDMDGDKPKRQRFKRYPIGCFHKDIAELQTAWGKYRLYSANGLRHDYRGQWDQTPADTTLPSMDQRPGSADEPDDHRRHRQTLPLRQPPARRQRRDLPQEPAPSAACRRARSPPFSTKMPISNPKARRCGAGTMLSASRGQALPLTQPPLFDAARIRSSSRCSSSAVSKLGRSSGRCPLRIAAARRA